MGEIPKMFKHTEKNILKSVCIKLVGLWVKFLLNNYLYVKLSFKFKWKKKLNFLSARLIKNVQINIKLP